MCEEIAGVLKNLSPYNFQALLPLLPASLSPVLPAQLSPQPKQHLQRSRAPCLQWQPGHATNWIIKHGVLENGSFTNHVPS